MDDTPPTLEQQIEHMKDAMVRLDIEMHNYQVRIDNALKGLIERLEEIYEQRTNQTSGITRMVENRQIDNL
jgi:predicted  nucleic acid-binding Zn-ribbon protein